MRFESRFTSFGYIICNAKPIFIIFHIFFCSAEAGKKDYWFVCTGKCDSNMFNCTWMRNIPFFYWIELGVFCFVFDVFHLFLLDTWNTFPIYEYGFHCIRVIYSFNSKKPYFDGYFIWKNRKYTSAYQSASNQNFTQYETA